MVQRIATAFLLAALAVLGGCASLDNLHSDVSSFSRWPAERKPATYAFERLPSQQAEPQQAQVLEDTARRAVEAAGFVAAADPASADVSIQLGARITAYDRSPSDDPFWYGPGGFYGPWGPWGYGRWGRPWGPSWRYAGAGFGPWGWPGYWGPGYGLPYYDREVAVLIRDRRTGEPLYEGRARSDGSYSGVTEVLDAMFRAALADFPKGSPTNPHAVNVPMKPA